MKGKNITDFIDVQWVKENPGAALELINIYREENKKTIEAIKVVEKQNETLKEMNLMKAVLNETKREERNEDYEIMSDWT